MSVDDKKRIAKFNVAILLVFKSYFASVLHMSLEICSKLANFFTFNGQDFTVDVNMPVHGFHLYTRMIY